MTSEKFQAAIELQKRIDSLILLKKYIEVTQIGESLRTEVKISISGNNNECLFFPYDNRKPVMDAGKEDIDYLLGKIQYRIDSLIVLFNEL